MTPAQQPKSNSQRQKASDDRHRALGRKGRKIWATLAEHDAIKRLLSEMRVNYKDLQEDYMNYLEFMNRSPEDIYLAIMDRLGVKLMPAVEHDHNDRSWADDLLTNNLK